MKIERPGEYLMRNGLRAWVKFRRVGAASPFVWVGERESVAAERCLMTWRDDGSRGMTSDDPYDIVSPAADVAQKRKTKLFTAQTEDRLVLLLVVAFTVVATLLTSFYYGQYVVQRQAIERGVAGYNSTTAEFEWK